MARKIQVEIIGDSSSLERAFRRAGGAGSKFGSAMRGLGKVAAVGVGGAFAGLAVILKTGFDELAEGQKVAAQTAAVLKSTGGAANVTAKQVSRLSESISAYSGVDDEAIQAGENLLLTFTKLQNRTGKGNKIFSRATKTIVDMSVALGQDMKSSAIQVGKALNDPIRGVTALRRVGVSFTKEQEKTIEGLVKSGKAMEAQKLILRELAVEFGGSARAYGSTLPGALAKLKNAFEGVTGALAEGLSPVVTDVAKRISSKLTDPEFVKRIRELGKEIGVKLVAAAEAIGNWFRDHWDEIKSGFSTATALARGTVTVIKEIAGAFQFLLRLGRPVFQVFIVQIKVLLALFSGLARALSHLPFIGGKFGGVADKIDAIRESTRALERALDALAGRGGMGQERIRLAPGALTSGGRLGGHPRAHGGPVMPGVVYRVGERGPETFVPRVAGAIVPNGGRGGDVVINLDGREIARVALDHLRAMGRNGATQTRGRHGGHNLALT